MSWAARLESATDGTLKLRFSEPLRELTLTSEVAKHLAALLVMAADQQSRRVGKAKAARTASRTG